MFWVFDPKKMHANLQNINMNNIKNKTSHLHEVFHVILKGTQEVPKKDHRQRDKNWFQ